MIYFEPDFVISANKLLLNGQWMDNQVALCVLLCCQLMGNSNLISLSIQSSCPPHPLQYQLLISPDINLDEKVLLCEG